MEQDHNYWRNAYKRMRESFAEQAGNTLPDLSCVDEMSEERA